MFECNLDHIVTAIDICFDTFHRIVFGDRYMLERSSMNYIVNPIHREI